jgi:hypothetical protein
VATLEVQKPFGSQPDPDRTRPPRPARRRLMRAKVRLRTGANVRLRIPAVADLRLAPSVLACVGIAALALVVRVVAEGGTGRAQTVRPTTEVALRTVPAHPAAPGHPVLDEHPARRVTRRAPRRRVTRHRAQPTPAPTPRHVLTKRPHKSADTSRPARVSTPVQSSIAAAQPPTATHQTGAGARPESASGRSPSAPSVSTGSFGGTSGGTQTSGPGSGSSRGGSSGSGSGAGGVKSLSGTGTVSGSDAAPPGTGTVSGGG